MEREFIRQFSHSDLELWQPFLERRKTIRRYGGRGYFEMLKTLNLPQMLQAFVSQSGPHQVETAELAKANQMTQSVIGDVGEGEVQGL